MKLPSLTTLIAVGTSLAAPLCLAQSGSPSLDDAWLRNLSSGSVLVIRRPIVIPANTSQQRITPSGVGLDCFIRMNRARPYTRVIREGRQLSVTGTDRSALSMKGRIASSTRIYLLSESVDDILCSGRSNQDDPRIRDFRQAVSPLISLQLPEYTMDVG